MAIVARQYVASRTAPTSSHSHEDSYQPEFVRTDEGKSEVETGARTGARTGAGGLNTHVCLV
ncbi:hypothetical protein EYF80_034286 [Liparis tanakae]|uniref:Uncharacterized protein n=1 Tax=Liparis tanakae TaxID=230148 RepID=A0A4Z2GSF4_9TELE|nr:hypothetical protein EYF80_034286 [Liparis tanakae]